VTAISFGGRFVLDLDTRELRDEGKTTSLSPKAYHLLEVLVTNRPKALSKSDLQQQLWPETFVVDKTGAIRYKQIGPITLEALQTKILPLVRELQKS